jgi:nucleoid-associated protein YgaU
MRFSVILLSLSAALGLTSCDMFRNDPQPNANDPYAQYGAGGAGGTQQTNPYGGYGAPTNPYGATGGSYGQPSTGGYAPPPAADPYAGTGGGYSSGGSGYSSGGGTGSGRNHTVVRGDTLSGIGRRYNVGVSDLMRANNLNSDLIREGQKLTIP